MIAEDLRYNTKVTFSHWSDGQSNKDYMYVVNPFLYKKAYKNKNIKNLRNTEESASMKFYIFKCHVFNIISLISVIPKEPDILFIWSPRHVLNM